MLQVTAEEQFGTGLHVAQMSEAPVVTLYRPGAQPPQRELPALLQVRPDAQPMIAVQAEQTRLLAVVHAVLS